MPRILGIPVQGVTMEEAVAQLEAMIAKGDSGYVVTANPEMVMAARANRALAQAMEGAALVVPDGVGLLWASRILGHPLPERVAGIDLLGRLLALSAQRGYRVYFLGARGEVIADAVANLQRVYPRLSIAGYHHGYFTPREEREILEEIKGAQPQILAVGLGMARQELWLAEHLPALRVPVGIGVGGSFDVLAGRLGRAPQWMQRRGLEWAFRLAQEPRRLRRMGALPRFAAAVLWEKFRGVGN
ncbi:MAG: WecB/TagA/CpsF family glycosyltransferase [Limnochordia bacterium]